MTDKLTEVLDMWEADAKVDRTELSDASTKCAKLHSKYLRIYMEYKQKAKIAEFKFKKMRKTKWMYFSGKLNGTVELEQLGWEPFPYTLKSDIDKWLEGDEQLAELQTKQLYNEQVVEACERILDEIKRRTYQLGNAITFERFIAGS